MRLLRTLSYMARIISVTMAVTLLLLSAPHSVKAEETPVFYYNELYKMNQLYWPGNNGNFYATPVTSLQPIIGVNWEVYQFALPVQQGSFLTGGAGIGTTPYLKTKTKVSQPISGILLRYDIDKSSCREKIEYISLTVSPNEDMSDGVTITADVPEVLVQNVDIIFRIPNPSPDMFYKIDFGLGVYSKNKWFDLKELRFALPESTKDLPDFSYVDNPASGKYTVNLSASEGRELHVMWGKYNSLNEPLGNCFEENSSLMSGPERAADIIKDPSKAWANKVESPYSKTFDVSSPFGEYYVLRAKTRRNGYPTDQSNEIIKVISKSGIVTGIDSIVDDSNVQPGGEEQWFNMQGVRISRPETPGIYVRVRDGKSSKIML